MEWLLWKIGWSVPFKTKNGLTSDPEIVLLAYITDS
jgi:hypothetical protein